MLKLRIHILYCFLISLVFIGCEDKVTFESKDSNKLNVECTLSPSSEVTAKVSTVNDFNNAFPISYPTDAILKLKVIGVDVSLTFEYDKARQLYFLRKNIYNINTSKEYKLYSFMNEEDADKFENVAESAVVKFAPVQKINFEKVVSFENKSSGLDNLKIKFSTPSQKNVANYFRVSTFLKNIHSGELIDLNYVSCDEDNLAFTQDKDLVNSQVFDARRFEDGVFTINFIPAKAIENLQDYRLYMNVESINESLYKYVVFKRKQFDALNKGFSDPVITYSNMINGYGVIGTTQAVVDSFELKF